MLRIDKKYLEELENKKIKKIFLYFYDAWCSWKKLDIMEEDFLLDWTELLEERWDISIYVKEEEKKYFENANIARIIKKDHKWEEKSRYIYNSEVIEDRCGCWSSFAFEKKKPKLNLENLKNLKKAFNK